MKISVRKVTTSKLLRSFIEDVLSVVPGAKLVRGKKHRALSVGARKIAIPSTPSGNEKRLVFNFKCQLKKLMVSEGLSILDI